MYTVTVTQDFPAQHYLTVPDPGPEGEPHTHHYEAEVRLSGESINEHGYLVDIDDVEAALTELVDHYRNTLLNETLGVQGNPSVERFARQFCEELRKELDAPHVDRIQVTMWEGEDAAGAFEQVV